MNTILDILLPAKAENTIRGSKWPLYLLILVASIGLVRSCIHIFAPDGGAGSIAEMNLSFTGANEVIFAFALWGAEQLIYALLQWVVIDGSLILRYRSLVPLMWIMQFLETLGRILVPKLKPVTFAHTPPGAYQNDLFLILSVSMAALAVWSGSKRKDTRAS